MRVHQETITVETPGRARPFTDITRRVAEIVSRAGVATGVTTVFVQHTSASLVIQENADPRVLVDLEAWAERAAPEDARYEHDDEGPDDMPAHIRSAITKTSESVPVMAGRLALGTWQALYLWEHRRAPHSRRVVVTVVGA
ncbi:MAG: YjbQ family protein [Myxococcales bacterium]|nr:YjbQ family protein [Myxococcales bacterium]